MPERERAIVSPSLRTSAIPWATLDTRHREMHGGRRTVATAIARYQDTYTRTPSLLFPGRRACHARPSRSSCRLERGEAF